MSKKTIYLHIGAPKTGTTSIQDYLAKNDDNLYADGYLVPKSSRAHKNNHTLLSEYCLDKNRITTMNIRNGIHSKKQLEQFKIDFYNGLRKEIKQFGGKGVIFSSEQCYGTLSSLKDIKKLKFLFENLHVEIKIIVYIREQSEMLCSTYSTRMKGGHTYTMLSQSEFSRIKAFDYNNRLKMWEEVFGRENILLRIFDKDKLIKNDVVSDFCETINIPRYSSALIQLNQSINAKQCEFLRLINDHIPVIVDKKVNPIRKNIRKIVASTNIESPPVSALINKEYLMIYDESNEELRNRYFEEEIALFNKKPLNDLSLDQRLVLSEADKKNIANQIIKNCKGEKNATLYKCIAAIFDVDYENKKIPMEYVYSMKMNNQQNRFSKKILQIYHLFKGH